MDMARLDGSLAVAPISLTRAVVRWAVLGAAGVTALILALSHSVAASAAAPACIPINYTTCVVPGTAYLNSNVGTVYAPAPVPTTSAYPPNTVVVPPYFDNRYGWVEVVTDGSGNLIDVNPFTGQRIYPVFSDFVGGFLPGYLAANVANVPIYNGFVPGAFTTAFTGCNVNFNCGGFPAGATYIGGGIYTYRDNRYCGDGMLGFIPGRGSYCMNGQPLVTNGGVTPVVYYRPFEATQPAAAPAAAPAPAPAAAPAAATQAPAPAASAPAQMPTALTAPQAPAAPAAPANTVHVLSAPAATAPAERGAMDDRSG